ncbi:hypothetical protein PSAB6_330065 [Paraburkholderia sabiae]|nr:hypothetical protein PSAB6_330065 [Paraburkholderia sabiae]
MTVICSLHQRISTLVFRVGANECVLFGMQAALFKILAPQRYFLPFSRRRCRLNQSARRLGFCELHSSRSFLRCSRSQQHGRSE